METAGEEIYINMEKEVMKKLEVVVIGKCKEDEVMEKEEVGICRHKEEMSKAMLEEVKTMEMDNILDFAVVICSGKVVAFRALILEVVATYTCSEKCSRVWDNVMAAMSHICAAPCEPLRWWWL